MKEIKDMTVDEMIDYLWVCYQVTGTLATLKLIESLANRIGEK